MPSLSHLPSSLHRLFLHFLLCSINDDDTSSLYSSLFASSTMTLSLIFLLLMRSSAFHLVSYTYNFPLAMDGLLRFTSGLLMVWMLILLMLHRAWVAKSPQGCWWQLHRQEA
ncbi:hypothetical protein GBA52_014790 [Prunus armeniaca]|nr:hypothetical protein GBA52_014790 [Prunus armeniaca]